MWPQKADSSGKVEVDDDKWDDLYETSQSSHTPTNDSFINMLARILYTS